MSNSMVNHNEPLAESKTEEQQTQDQLKILRILRRVEAQVGQVL